jgi:preprotein translocase subunit SecA
LQTKAELITEQVLKHLEAAEQAIRFSWGVVEFARLSSIRLNELDETVRRGILDALDTRDGQALMNQTLVNFSQNQRNVIASELGRRALTEVYRQVLLGVITELWVDYLTQMEALRVSIGLEAYAQRDPLVQYKSRLELSKSARCAPVCARMFAYRPLAWACGRA